jgi:hypothetical protein
MVRLAVPARSPPVWLAVDRVLRAQRNLPQPGAIHHRVCAVLRLARAALVSGARRTADAERRRRPLSGSSSKLRLSAFAEPLSTALALAHGVQGQELADRVVTHHDLVGHRGDQRAAGGRADVGHESQLRGGQARAEQRDGHHRDAAQHHDLLQHWAPDAGYPARVLWQRRNPAG